MYRTLFRKSGHIVRHVMTQNAPQLAVHMMTQNVAHLVAHVMIRNVVHLVMCARVTAHLNDDRSVDDINWYRDVFADSCPVTHVLLTGSGSSSLYLLIIHNTANSTVNMITKKKDSACTNVKSISYNITELRTYVTGFAKKGLIHTSGFATLMSHNFVCD